MKNNLKNDVAFYLDECNKPLLAIDFRELLLQELIQTYGEDEVNAEIKNQKL
jgi:hypothetical protein